MSLGYKDSNVIGGPLDKTVRDQLKIRKEAIKNRNQRTEIDLQYLGNTTGWVRALSSINALKYDSELRNQPARRYILQAGVGRALYNDESSTKITGTGLRGGFEGVNGAQDISSYSTSELTGFTPMPGITNLIVKSKNTFGTLREATLEFTAHSVEDFSELEKLYMRPGYTVLIEWGHSTYLNKDGEFQTRVEKYDVGSFFESQKVSIIETEIKKYKEINQGNYDAIFGFIKNFSWSYNGTSYLCSIDIISKGELIESISMDVPTSGTKIPGKKENKDTDEKKTKAFDARQITTDLHKFLYCIKNASSEKYEKVTLGNVVESTITDEAIEKYVKEYTGNLYTQVVDDLKNSGAPLRTSDYPVSSQVVRYQIIVQNDDNSGQWGRAVSLRTVLSILNHIFLAKSANTPLLRFYTGKKEGPSTTFYTFQEHIGLDPKICILGKTSDNKSAIRYQVGNQANLSLEEQQDILNIFLDVDYLMDVADKILQNAKDSAPSVIDYVYEILRDVQKNLGSINEFDLHHDEETSILYVVDRKVVPGKKAIKESFIDLVGLNSEIENLNITSKLSSKISSMIAVASADSSPAGVASDVLNIQKWNRGLYDRHLKEKEIGNEYFPFATSISTSGRTQFIHSYNSKGELVQQTRKIPPTSTELFVNFLNNVNASTYYMGYNKQDLNGYINIHRRVMRELGKDTATTKEENPHGLIPFELSFSIKGIGGIKIGQSFTIPDVFLPERYRNEVGFLVTGVEHRITNGRWITDIRTQMIILTPFDKQQPLSEDIIIDEDTQTVAQQKSDLDNYGKIALMLKNLGVTKEGAMGFLGNVKAESNGDPTALEFKVQPVIGGKGGLGIVQWTASRRRSIESAAKKDAATLLDIDFQTGYLSNELKRQYARVLSVLQKTDSVEIAAQVVLEKFEIPATFINKDKNPGAYAATLAKRTNFSKGFKDVVEQVYKEA